MSKLETKPKAAVYTPAVGRRKTAVAQVRVTPKSKFSITVNGKALSDHFRDKKLQEIAMSPMRIADMPDVEITVVVRGGGSHGQAEAIRHGISRALQTIDPLKRKVLKVEGYLSRDAREKERKKPGLKKARKKTQWRKR